MLALVHNSRLDHHQVLPTGLQLALELKLEDASVCVDHVNPFWRCFAQQLIEWQLDLTQLLAIGQQGQVYYLVFIFHFELEWLVSPDRIDATDCLGGFFFASDLQLALDPLSWFIHYCLQDTNLQVFILIIRKTNCPQMAVLWLPRMKRILLSVLVVLVAQFYTLLQGWTC